MPRYEQAAAMSNEAEIGSDRSVVIYLDELLERRGLTLAELANRVGVTVVNLSILKNGRARAVRFTTLAAICETLDCQPGDLLRVRFGATVEDGDLRGTTDRPGVERKHAKKP